jgi:hypothetical protein
VHDPKPRGLFRLGSMESTAAMRFPPTTPSLRGRALNLGKVRMEHAASPGHNVTLR